MDLYSSKVIANVLSFNNVVRRHHVKYDSNKYNTFIIYSHCKQIKFVPLRKGLYYYNMKSNDEQLEFCMAHIGFSYTMVTTVKDQIRKYTLREIKNTEKARLLYNNVD